MFLLACASLGIRGAGRGKAGRSKHAKVPVAPSLLLHGLCCWCLKPACRSSSLPLSSLLSTPRDFQNSIKITMEMCTPTALPTGLPLGTYRVHGATYVVGLPDSPAWAAAPQPSCPSSDPWADTRGNGNSALMSVAGALIWIAPSVLVWLLGPLWKPLADWLWEHLPLAQQIRLARLVRIFEDADRVWAGLRRCWRRLRREMRERGVRRRRRKRGRRRLRAIVRLRAILC